MHCLWLTVLLVANVLSFSTCKLFHHETTFSSCRPVDGFTARVDACDILECARICSQQTNCLSFFYTVSDQECQLHDLVLDYQTYQGSIEQRSNTKYYTQNDTGGHGSSQTPSDPSPTSGLTSTTAQANSCPVHDGDWKLVELSDGSKSYVKVFTDVTVSKDEATDRCSAQNGTVLKITTLTKLTHFRDSIFVCPDLSGQSFWLDGTNAGTGQWRTSDGESIPMTQGVFWVYGRPNSPEIHHCLRLWPEYGYLFDDISCYNSNMAKCMCEKQYENNQ